MGRFKVYEALTVAINQLVHRNRNGYGKRQGFLPHPALPGREDVIAAQLDTTTLGSPAAQARLEKAYWTGQKRALARANQRRW